MIDNPFSDKLVDKEPKEVKVKFNFPLMNPKFDFSLALKKAKEEKSVTAFEMQSRIDFNQTTSMYEAGKTYDVPLHFYQKFIDRTVEVSNPLRGDLTNFPSELFK